MDLIVGGLNPAQKAAVTSPAAVLQVLAPPGSGKTKTLTARVAYLIAHDGLDPRRIIVCTFTIKAAKEMKDRIEGLLGKAVASRLILGTFHSVARRFLAIHGHLVGIPDKFGIADSGDSSAIISRIIKLMRLTIDPSKARARISNLKAHRISPERYAASSRRQKDGDNAEDIYIVYSAYEEELKLSDLLDYDDLLVRCEELLDRFPNCVSHIESVLVDEFQDTNHVQFELMCRFAQHRRCITTVGDPDQSIYGWRSADVTNLSQMRERFPETHVVNLEENYRSSGMILLAAQDIIDQDHSRPQKRLVPTHCLGISPVLRYLTTADIEARWTVDEIKRTMALSAGLFGYNDYAILLRSAYLSRLFETQLGKEGIPYRMVGGHRFFDRVEVKLVLDYLRVVDSTNHGEALTRILNTPSRRVGDATVSALSAEASQTKASLWSLVQSAGRGGSKHKTKITPQTRRGISNFCSIITAAQGKLRETSADTLVEFIQWFLRKLDMKTYITEKYPRDADARWANVQELTAQASELVGLAKQEASVSEPTDVVRDEGPESIDVEVLDSTPITGSNRAEQLSLFLGNVALATDKQAATDGKEALGRVTISTIHAAKGLEFSVVFVPAIHEDSIPHSRAEDIDEERRLLYVAMTRAQALLYLSCPRENSRGSSTTLSRFISSQTLAPRFLQKGPVLKFLQIQEMAGVLRRDCPSEAEITIARTNATQKEDDRWSSGEPDEDPDGDDPYDYCERPLKRQRPDWVRGAASTNGIAKSSSTMVSTSMSSSSTFSISAANFSSSFVSAATVARLDVAQEQQSAERCASTVLETSSGVGGGRPKPPPTGQQGITAFFGKASLAVTKPTMHLEPLPEKARSPLSSVMDPHSRAWNESTFAEGSCPAPRNSLTPGVRSEHAPQRKTLGVRRTMGGWPPPSRST